VRLRELLVVRHLHLWNELGEWVFVSNLKVHAISLTSLSRVTMVVTEGER
jgi:hypothetical protein